MEKNEPFVIAASYFWSGALNAFVFGHGPMTPTLADVLLLTGLDISSSDTPFDYLIKPSHRLETKGIGGWKGYIRKNMRTGTVSEREYTAFLMMWLEKHFFCGRAVDPSSNTQALAEALSLGSAIPLGKHLLGSAYHMMHQIGTRLSKGEPIGNPGSPWWFITLWLNLYTSKVSQQRIETKTFPNIESEENPTVRRRCRSFGEAASAFPGCQFTTARTAEYFRCFYNGFSEETVSWYPYRTVEPIFELPVCYDSSTHTFDRELMDILIKPGILPANFFSGKDSPTYEFYNPSVAARQLGFGQLPIRVYFAGQAKFRDELTKSLDYNRLCNLVPDSSTIDLNNWTVASFAVQQFKLSWAEWKQYLFCKSSSTYYNILDPEKIDPSAAVCPFSQPISMLSLSILSSYR
ncbi:hypothetical protein C2845_PM11G17080 [Panicum miliaceum]|uniref:Aminotransferase-like plant mobile domain-containing protein n=1 Tax=Panicum miliaceum TaxID=4540 RepID=A0A3L6RVY0_PANMI|nr:hypothetical protein C2845_PM11G17080 [Panicum miliaceum]